MTPQAHLEENGWALWPEQVDEDTCRALCHALDALPEVAGTRARGGEPFAIRNLFPHVPEVCRVAISPPLWSAAATILGPEARAVRATLIDKRAGANWSVGWHQDLTIAVRERHELTGWDRWSVKAGVDCVQPPGEVLAGMLAVRLSLDACDADSGALKLADGTHRLGRVSPLVEDWRQSASGISVPSIPRGGVLLMRPLLYHASSPLKHPEGGAYSIWSTPEQHCRLRLSGSTNCVRNLRSP